eukprot:scaffold276612_cov39-Prasinocladus_malaysianus.AAC.2
MEGRKPVKADSSKPSETPVGITGRVSPPSDDPDEVSNARRSVEKAAKSSKMSRVNDNIDSGLQAWRRYSNRHTLKEGVEEAPTTSKEREESQQSRSPPAESPRQAEQRQP